MIRFKINCFFILNIFAALSMSMMINTVPAYAEELYQAVDLKAEANLQSDTVASIKKGYVKVLERKGFWVKVRVQEDLDGWVQLSNVKMKEEILWMRPIDTLRDTGRLHGIKKNHPAKVQ